MTLACTSSTQETMEGVSGTPQVWDQPGLCREYHLSLGYRVLSGLKSNLPWSSAWGQEQILGFTNLCQNTNILPVNLKKEGWLLTSLRGCWQVLSRSHQWDSFILPRCGLLVSSSGEREKRGLGVTYNFPIRINTTMFLPPQKVSLATSVCVWVRTCTYACVQKWRKHVLQQNIHCNGVL